MKNMKVIDNHLVDTKEWISVNGKKYKPIIDFENELTSKQFLKVRSITAKAADNLDLNSQEQMEKSDEIDFEILALIYLNDNEETFNWNTYEKRAKEFQENGMSFKDYRKAAEHLENFTKFIAPSIPVGFLQSLGRINKAMQPT